MQAGTGIAELVAQETAKQVNNNSDLMQYYIFNLQLLLENLFKFDTFGFEYIVQRLMSIVWLFILCQGKISLEDARKKTWLLDTHVSARPS